MMAKPWNEYRHTITKLYITDGRKLEDVRNIMKTEFGFEASIRSYRQHFDLWGVGKYNCKKRQRRRESFVRALLPSPPRTPVVDAASAMEIRHDVVLGLPGATTAPSPVALSRSGSSSGGSQHSPEQRPLPDPSHPRLDHMRFPFYAGPTSSDLVFRSKSALQTRCLTAMGPPSGNWEDQDLQDALPNTTVAEGFPPFVKPSPPPLPSESLRTTDESPLVLRNTSSDTAKLPTKYSQQPSYSEPANWNVSRPTAGPGGFPHSCGADECYRLYATPRMSESFSGGSIPRSLDHGAALRSTPTIPRLSEGRAAGRLATSHMSFEGIVSS